MSLTKFLVTIWCFTGFAAALASLPGTVELFCLTVAAILPRRSKSRGVKNRFERLAVVVPAHNEEANAGACIASLQHAERPDFQVEIVVVADNCNDRTAEVAAKSGARTLIRTDLDHRGKGYALDFAFKSLLAEGVGAFLVVDADTEVAPNFLREAGGMLQWGADAVQCRYLVKNAGESIRTRLMNVAFLAFNVTRPRGRDRLGLSCGIYGNGFGMRRETLEQVPYLAASVVEDLEYHLCLIRAAKRVRFVDHATVRGAMPAAGKGVETQRSRWEGGRLRIVRERTPGLALDVMNGRFRALEPMLDLLLLPLAFHVTLLIVAASTPYPIVRAAGLLGLAVVAMHLLVAIFVGRGGWRDFAALLAAPFYVFWKLLLIPSLVRSSKNDSAWVRTERKTDQKSD
jgi:cellulose synthase/poly-beta-1,6-N-acetylglucosamine synthase-like glycosyltransferase